MTPTNNFHDAVKPNIRLGVCLLALLVNVLCGCGAPAEPEAVQKQSASMRGLAVSYGQYISQHRGRPPKSEKVLRKFIEEQSDTFLDSFSAESIDDLFTSPRDNEPYVVVYGKKASVVAYEKVGVDGKRFVAYDIGGVEEVDEAKFAELVPDAE